MGGIRRPASATANNSRMLVGYIANAQPFASSAISSRTFVPLIPPTKAIFMKYRFQNVLLQNFHIQRFDRIRGNTELRGQHIPAPADEHADFALPRRFCHRIIGNRLKAFTDFYKDLTLVKASKSQNNTVIIQNLQLIIRKNDTEDIVV